MAENPILVKFEIKQDRKSTRLNSSHQIISYAVFCLKKTQQTLTHARLDGLPAAPAQRIGLPPPGRPTDGGSPFLAVPRPEWEIFFFLKKTTTTKTSPPPPDDAPQF